MRLVVIKYLATRHFGAGGLKPAAETRKSRPGATRRLVFSALTQRVRFYGSGPDFLDLSAGHFNGPAQSVGSLDQISVFASRNHHRGALCLLIHLLLRRPIYLPRRVPRPDAQYPQK